ncbi:Smr/MutS family protein [Lysobacter sp. A3-1-A15]|uniref:Smr/MutS family protein n=1 Tax=Novilysobacter viscosus TaxID=3098602 RepID=UPI002ED85EB2
MAKRDRPPTPPSDPGDASAATDPGDLFRSAVGPVRPLQASDRAPAPPPPKPRARMAELDEIEAVRTLRRMPAADVLAAGDALSHRREAVPVPVFKRLKRGEIAAQDELDLHGAGAVEAERVLRTFIAQAQRDGLGCVRIIHGKGVHAEAPFGGPGLPVVKNVVDRVLRQRADVLAFHSAPPAQGGTGAVLVLLAPRRR